MPTCQNCKNTWTWKQTIKTIFKFKCPNCGKKQYESAKSKKRSAFVSFLPLIPLPILAFLNFPFPLQVSISIIVILSIAFLVIYPFIIELSNEEEALF